VAPKRLLARKSPGPESVAPLPSTHGRAPPGVPRKASGPGLRSPAVREGRKGPAYRLLSPLLRARLQDTGVPCTGARLGEMRGTFRIADQLLRNPWLTRISNLWFIWGAVVAVGAILRALAGSFTTTSLAFLVCGGVLLLLSLGVAAQRLAKRQLSARRRPRHDDALYGLLESWATPAYEAARILLDSAGSSAYRTRDPNKEDLALLLQRALDDSHNAHARAVGAIEALDGADQQEAFGEFYRQYQGMSSFILRSIERNIVSADAFWYGEWRRRDERFLGELRKEVGTRERETLRQHVYGVGWGEGVRQKLPVPSS
jgi:hypothetical protein